MLHVLLPRELLLLALFLVLGLGPATHLPGPSRRLVRLALAPGLGVGLASVVLVTVNFAIPLRHALWFLLVPMGAASAAVAWRGGLLRPPEGSRRRPAIVAALALVAVAAVPLATLNRPLDERLSHGPIGYGIFDAPGYVTFVEGFKDHTNTRPFIDTSYEVVQPNYVKDGGWTPDWDISLAFGWNYKFQHTSAFTVAAAASGGTGWPSWQLVTPFIIALVAAGALGVLGLTLQLTGSIAASSLAGAAFAGPVISTIFVDGSGGLIAGLTVVPPLAIAGLAALARPTVRRVVAFGAVMAALQAIYPELVVLPGLAAAVAVATVGLTRLRQGTLDRAMIRRGIGLLVLAGVACLLLSPRTAPWTVSYLAQQADAQGNNLDNLIDYQMPLRNVVGWIFGTRDFYEFAFSPQADPGLVKDLLLPLALVAAAMVAIARLPVARPLGAFVVAVVIQAAIAAPELDCSYCVQRTMLSLPPILLALVAAGLVLVARRSRVWRDLTVALAAAALIASFTVQERVLDRASAAAWMPSLDTERVADAVRPLKDPVTMEGFDAQPLWSWGDQPTTYMALIEATHARISTPDATNDYGGYSFMKLRAPGHPVFDPRYRYVVSRLGALDSGRRTIARFGPVKLEEREGPFDVTVARGVAVDDRRGDPTGVSYVQQTGSQIGLEQGPPTFWVTGRTPQKAFLHLVFAAPPTFKVTAAGVRQAPRADSRWDVCLPVPGRQALRIVTLDVSPAPGPLQPPVPGQSRPRPDQSIRLDAVRATTERC